MTDKKRRVLTGTRPSGSPHLGNYFGAFQPMIKLQDHYEFFFFLADLHALNGTIGPDELRRNSYEMLATLLACGLDPKRGLIFTQSSVPEVSELAWILCCQTPLGMLLRAHSYKDAVSKGIDVNMGVFNYPVLMAADILLYDADIVPVGQDQKQHIEITRDMAQRFNNRYGNLLTIPEPLISDTVAIILGTDGQKMSKSKNNVVSIFATDKDWKKQIMSIVTDITALEDPKDPERCNVFALYKLVATQDEVQALAEKYAAGHFGYGHAKLELFAKIKERFGPMRDRYFDLIRDHDSLRQIVLEGSKQAREIARSKLDALQGAIGTIGRSL